MANRQFVPPIKGISESMPVANQEPMTTRYMKNVRAPGSLEKQVRLAQRPGIKKWSSTDVSGGTESPIIEMISITVGN